MKYSLTLSLIGHLLIAIFACYQLASISTVKYGNNEREMISSYLVNTQKAVATSKPVIKQIITPVIPHAIALQTQKKIIPPETKTSAAQTRSAIKGEPMPALICRQKLPYRVIY